LEAAGQPKSGILPQIVSIVHPEHFLEKPLRVVYGIMLTIEGPLNEITVGALLLPSYAPIFPRCMAACPCWMDWESYAKVVAGQKPKVGRLPDGGARL
jgi:hypothetical protein